MEIVLTGSAIQAWDKNTVEDYEISELILMENAGERIYQKIFSDYHPSQAVIFIGKGNNGGDGLVIARKLSEQGTDLLVLITASDCSELSESAQKNFAILKQLKIPYCFIPDISAYQNHRETLLKTPFLIDALLGTGLKQPARGLIAEIILDLNQNYSGTILAIDVPSGLSTGLDFFRPVLKAHKTYTVETPKVNCLDYPGKSYTGILEVIKIGFPTLALGSDEKKYWNVQEKDLSLPERPKDSHKGDYKKLLILGGSKKYCGAAQLCATSALKTGVGLIYYSGHANQHIQHNLPEIIVLDELQDFTSFSAILAGPGWDQGDPDLLKYLLEHFQGKLILDADALNILAADQTLLKNRPNLVLTPHIKEFSRLMQTEPGLIKENKLAALTRFNHQYPFVSVLLKDSVSIFLHQNQYYYLGWGSPALARGGSGDLLAGLIAGFAAYLPLQDAVFLAAYLNGKTAELLEKTESCYGITPTLLSQHYSLAWQALKQPKK